MDAVREPMLRLPGRMPGEERFYLEGVGPSRYLKVASATPGEVGSASPPGYCLSSRG